MAFLFPDNTVMINFAVIDQLELLQNHLRGRGKVFSSVEREIHKSSQMTPNLAKVDTSIWFGKALELNQDSSKEVERIRRNVFGGTTASPLKHLGESETLYGVYSRPDLQGSSFLTDDEDAVGHARFLKLRVLTTCELLRAMCADGDITSTQAHSHADHMVALGRALLEVPDGHHWYNG